MTLILWTVPYLLGGAVFWFVVYRIAPPWCEVTVRRTVLAVVLMRVSDLASMYLLSPLLGDWHVLVFVAASIAIAKLVFRMPVWRAVVAVFAYGVIVGLTSLGLTWMAKPASSVAPGAGVSNQAPATGSAVNAR